MSLRQTRPGGGSERKRTHFIHNKTPRGGKWDAWIAGPCHWFECHVKGRSKPCLEVVTNGELKCELCSPLNPRQVLGYQPLFKGSDGRPCFCVVHECSADQIDQLKFRQPVLVGRDDGATDTVWVMPALAKKPWHITTIAEFQQPADLTPSLIAIWKLPALTEWFGKRTLHKIQDQNVQSPVSTPLVVTSDPSPELINSDEVPAVVQGPIPFPRAELADIFDANAEKDRARAEREARTAEWIRNQPLKGNGKHKPHNKA